MRIQNLITRKDIFPDSDNIISILSNERFVITPQETKTIILPYKVYIDENEVIFFNFSYKLAEKGLSCINSNIYEVGAENLEIILNNLRVDNQLSQLEILTGSSKKIDIRPNSLLGRLFSIKTS